MKYYYFIALFFFATRLFSQNSGVNEDPDYFNCGKNNVTEALYEKYPAQRAIAELATAELEEFSRNYENSPLRDDDVIIIPIVFHIIHNNGSENISDAQVQSAIDVINADFKLVNTIKCVDMNGLFQIIHSFVVLTLRLCNVVSS